MSAVDNDTEEYSWNIISKYFKHNPKALVEHHIDSYNLFVNKGNYIYFLEKYAQYIQPIANTFAYCFMPNHFHIAIQLNNNGLKVHRF